MYQCTYYQACPQRAHADLIGQVLCRSSIKRSCKHVSIQCKRVSMRDHQVAASAVLMEKASPNPRP